VLFCFRCTQHLLLQTIVNIKPNIHTGTGPSNPFHGGTFVSASKHASTLRRHSHHMLIHTERVLSQATVLKEIRWINPLESPCETLRRLNLPQR